VVKLIQKHTTGLNKKAVVGEMALFPNMLISEQDSKHRSLVSPLFLIYSNF
jgi:hypothetical protein